MVVAWQTDFMYIEYRQLFLLNCSDRVQCSSFHIGYAACLPVGVVDLPMNTIDGGVEGMHKDWNGDAQLLKIKNCCGMQILVLAAAKYWSWESLAPQWAPLGSSIVSIARAIDSLEAGDLWLGQSIHCAARPKRQKPLSDFSWYHPTRQPFVPVSSMETVTRIRKAR